MPEFEKNILRYCWGFLVGYLVSGLVILSLWGCGGGSEDTQRTIDPVHCSASEPNCV